MANLEKRVAKLECARADVTLKAMTDDELDDYILNRETGSTDLYKAIIAKVLRHLSSFPVVATDYGWDKK